MLGHGLPRRQVPRAEPTLEGGITDDDKTPWLPVASAGRAYGGVQHRLYRRVGHGFLAEVTYRPLAVNDVEERHGFVRHCGPPHPTLSLTKYKHQEKRIMRVIDFDTIKKPPPRHSPAAWLSAYGHRQAVLSRDPSSVVKRGQ